MNGIINIASAAAIKAGKAIIQGFNQLERVNIYEKSAYNFVSDIDHKSEEIIISDIQKAFPTHGIISEECGVKPGSEFTWIIDPLDGTNNFIHGFPHFCVSIAVMQNGSVEYAVIYDPIKDELYSATKGRGAQLNNSRIRISNRSKLLAGILATGCPSHDEKVIANYMPILQEMMIKTAGIRRSGSAALDLAYVASGRLDGTWQAGLKAWDIAAGSLIVKEAGGVVYDYNKEEKYLESGNVIASNIKIIKDILDIVNR